VKYLHSGWSRKSLRCWDHLHLLQIQRVNEAQLKRFVPRLMWRKSWNAFLWYRSLPSILLINSAIKSSNTIVSLFQSTQLVWPIGYLILYNQCVITLYSAYYVQNCGISTFFTHDKDFLLTSKCLGIRHLWRFFYTPARVKKCILDSYTLNGQLYANFILSQHYIVWISQFQTHIYRLQFHEFFWKLNNWWLNNWKAKQLFYVTVFVYSFGSGGISVTAASTALYYTAISGSISKLYMTCHILSMVEDSVLIMTKVRACLLEWLVLHAGLVQ
jgi:hypothetical protein